MRVVVLRISNRKFVILPETILFITAFLKYCAKALIALYPLPRYTYNKVLMDKNFTMISVSDSSGISTANTGF